MTNLLIKNNFKDIGRRMMTDFMNIADGVVKVAWFLDVMFVSNRFVKRA